MNTEPESWIKQAICKGMNDLFFPEEDSNNAYKVYQNAKQICNGCPVVAECLSYALDNQIYFGVWGAKSPKERRTMYRNSLYSIQ